MAANDGIAPAYACGALVATIETLPTGVSMIVSVKVDSSSAVIVSVTVTISPPSLEVVGETVPVLEDRGLELEVAIVVDVLVAMLEVAGFELEVTVVVNVPAVMPGGGGFELGVIGGTFGNVVFRAGHPEVPVSRRTGH